MLVNQGRPVVAYFLAVADACQDGKAAANWITQDVLRVLKERSISFDELPVSTGAMAEMIVRIKSGELPATRARDVFQAMVDTGVDVGQAMTALGIASVDDSELMALCQRIVAANPKVAADVRNGKMQAIGAFVGQARNRIRTSTPIESVRSAWS